MVSYPRKVALSVAVVSVLASGWFGYMAIRSVWIDTPAPAPVVAAEVAQPQAQEPQRVQKPRKGQRHD